MWKTISGYPDYQVSDAGEIKSFKQSKLIIMKLLIMGGYRYVTLCRKGDCKKRYVHRLVLDAFIGPCPKGLEANHLDGDKLNNYASNLEYVTRSENAFHALRMGLRKDAKPVIQKSKAGQFVAEYSSVHEAFRQTGANIGNISSCCLGKRPVAGGFVWRFAGAK